MEQDIAFTGPAWVPEGARRYLAHTEAGRPIREIARLAGCHASTILRQIRRIETRRDDPLVDAALHALADAHFSETVPQRCTQDAARQDDGFADEALRVLRRLCEAGAMLAVAEDMDKAVVVRDDGQGNANRTAVVAHEVAQAMALKDWISCETPGRISRYRVTSAGRSALGQLTAQFENRARAGKDEGFSEARSLFANTQDADREGRPRRVRFCAPDSPLASLARRKDRDGRRFLSDALVQAGERLREDFELAQIGPQVTQNWDRFLTGGSSTDFGSGEPVGIGATGARDRVARALADLGPGLSDVALRCCCYLEGLETAEKRMGWSARSGKIVLRIALQRLKRHYDRQAEGDRMIG